MSEQEQHSEVPAARTPRNYSGVGAVGGTGFAAGIFTALGLSRILSNTDGSYAAGYPILVFGMVAFFILISALVLAPLSPDGRKFAWFGAGSFFLITAAGAYIFYRQTYDNPTAYVTASFTPDPSTFADVNSEKKLQLVLQYRTARGAGQFAPWNKRISVNGSDVVELRLDGLEALERAYVDGYNANQQFQRELRLACQGVKSDVCFMVNAHMGTDMVVRS